MGLVNCSHKTRNAKTWNAGGNTSSCRFVGWIGPYDFQHFQHGVNFMLVVAVVMVTFWPIKWVMHLNPFSWFKPRNTLIFILLDLPRMSSLMCIKPIFHSIVYPPM